MTSLVLEPKEFRLLEGLRLNPRKSFGGRIRGERLTQKRGVSIDFADYREYSEGDDLRHLDWNVLARLDSPIMKTYRDEEDLAVYLLLDLSESMTFGEPPKVEAARRLACALGYAGLNGGDAVFVRRLGVRERPPTVRRGRANYPRLANDLQEERTGAGELGAAIKVFGASSARAGLVIILSDGLDPEITNAIRLLGGRGHEVLFLQILSAVELDPDLEGDLRLLDAESGQAVEITANSFALKEYRRRLTEHNDALAEAVRRIGGRYVQVRSDTTTEAFLKGPARREGWVV